MSEAASSVSTQKNGDQSCDRSRKRKRRLDPFDFHVSFEELSTRYPDFEKEYRKLSRAQQSSGKSFSTLVTQDFNIALTRALLRDNFDLSMTRLPSDRLCPPVPNRYAYVHWIKDKLLPMLQRDDYFQEETSLTHCGIDIGTGASCIYPLLFCASEPAESTSTTWKIVATDVDPESVSHAQMNVAANNLSDCIHVALVEPTNSTSNKGPVARSFEVAASSAFLQCADGSSSPSTFDFVMTNPPFYDDEHSTERTDPRVGDDRSRIPMSSNEGSYPGGEVGFVLDMLRDSLVFQRKVSWYTAMFGKKASFLKVRELLFQLLGTSCVQETEVTSGQMTRWFLAWTFMRPRIRSPAARIKSALQRFEVHLEAPTESDAIAEVAERIRVYCDSMSLLNEVCSVTLNVNCPEKAVVTVCEKNPPAYTLNLDDIETAKPIPQRVSRGMCQTWNVHDFLPIEGHFVVDFAICSSNTRNLGSAKSTDGNKGATVSVSLDCYRHSVRGGRFVEKIRRLEGEVCRTNRKWRRFQKQRGKTG